MVPLRKDSSIGTYVYGIVLCTSWLYVNLKWSLNILLEVLPNVFSMIIFSLIAIWYWYKFWTFSIIASALIFCPCHSFY